jgi:hypothetical protein
MMESRNVIGIERGRCAQSKSKTEHLRSPDSNPATPQQPAGRISSYRNRDGTLLFW